MNQLSFLHSFKLWKNACLQVFFKMTAAHKRTLSKVKIHTFTVKSVMLAFVILNFKICAYFVINAFYLGSCRWRFSVNKKRT